MKEISGKVAFVTGAANGIGLGICRALARAGAHVALADIQPDVLERARQEIAALGVHAIALPLDVSDAEAVARAADAVTAEFGKVHIVCNNAGVAVGGPLGTVTKSDWDWIIDVNLKGVIYGVETFVPLIRGHGEGGHIVNTASMAGMVSPPGMEPYTATKFAVVAMSEGWSAQLAPFSIGVSVLCPGFVRTRIHESGRNRQAKYGGDGDVDPGLNEERAAGAQLVLSGIDPDIVGTRVVEAVRDNELYIFTHPQFKDAAEARFASIRAAFDRAAASPALTSAKS